MESDLVHGPANMRIETPCINICVLDADSGLCLGCRRTRDEIAGWLGLSAIERRRIMADLPMRTAGRAETTAAPGGAP